MSGRSIPPLSEIDARRIVLLKPSSLGDVVHSLPILTAFATLPLGPYPLGRQSNPTPNCCTAIPIWTKC